MAYKNIAEHLAEFAAHTLRTTVLRPSELCLFQRAVNSFRNITRFRETIFFPKRSFGLNIKNQQTFLYVRIETIKTVLRYSIV
jgi:hypothetical protein